MNTYEAPLVLTTLWRQLHSKSQSLTFLHLNGLCEILPLVNWHKKNKYPSFSLYAAISDICTLLEYLSYSRIKPNHLRDINHYQR